MIKFKAKDLTHVPEGCTSTLVGNSGEEQLIIVASWGQDFACSLVIVATQCDGASRVLFNGKGRYGPVATLMKVKFTVDAWSTGGIKPTEEEEKKRVKQTRKLLVLLSEHWHIGDDVLVGDKVLPKKSKR